MKKYVSLLLLLFMLCFLPSIRCDAYSEDGSTPVYKSDDGKWTFEIYDYKNTCGLVNYKGKSKNVTIPKTVKLNGKKYNVTYLAYECFRGKGVKLVTFKHMPIFTPAYSIFAGCDSLNKVVLKGVTLPCTKRYDDTIDICTELYALKKQVTIYYDGSKEKECKDCGSYHPLGLKNEGWKLKRTDPYISINHQKLKWYDPIGSSWLANKSAGLVSKQEYSVGLFVKDSGDLSAKVHNGKAKWIKFKSSNPKQISVSKKGVITAKTAPRGRSINIIITAKVGKKVIKKVVSVYVDTVFNIKQESPIWCDLLTTSKQQVSDSCKSKSSIKWKIKNPKIASVSKTGVVKGLNPGDTFLIINYKGYKEKFPVHVTKPVIKQDLKLYDNTSVSYSLSITGKAKIKKVWSTNKAILKVDSKNKALIGVSSGTAYIKVKFNTGLVIKKKVQVYKNEISYTPKTFDDFDYGQSYGAGINKAYFKNGYLMVEARFFNMTDEVLAYIPDVYISYCSRRYRLNLSETVYNIKVDIEPNSYKDIVLRFKKNLDGYNISGSDTVLNILKDDSNGGFMHIWSDSLFSEDNGYGG